MSPATLTCPSCKKMNADGGRYCIHCGTVLNPIYCSSCGTINPEGLEQCLECGSPMPSLAGLRWNPVVTVINPTSAMIEEKNETFTERVTPDPNLEWLRSKFDRHKKTGNSMDSSENSRT